MNMQLALTDPTWPCNLCNGRGVETDPETGQERRCRVFKQKRRAYGHRLLRINQEDDASS